MTVHHLDSEVQAVTLYSVTGLRFLNRDLSQKSNIKALLVKG